jgi:hypothetical protein
MARHVERPGIVGDLVERVVDGADSRPAAAPCQRRFDLVVAEAGDDDGFLDAIRGQRIQLAIEQGASCEIDQALGAVDGKVPEPRTLAGGKNNCLHGRGSCPRIAAPVGHGYRQSQ